MRLGLIGFGEAASAIARGLKQAGWSSMAAYDAVQSDAMKAKARDAGVEWATSLDELVRQSDIVCSLVTAGVAVDVAKAAASHLRPGALYADFNSCSPAVKREVGDVIKSAQPAARYAAVAVMSAVKPHGHRVPLVADGDGARALQEALAPYGCRIEVLNGEVGGAALLKMCRSAVLKGLEALFLEALAAAESLGVADRVLDSLDASFPEHHLRDLAWYLVERNLAHAERRAHELGEVVDTLRSLGMEPLVAEGGYRRLQHAAAVRASLNDPAEDVRQWLQVLARAHGI
ncbi:NAD(P)-dependent oxidoreductase [Alicyclobacillus sendaiensis]|uniref:DUF1932 domain-containing protein n=1 Tax=Alicyclobacillus sendaiensis PA2 TaxID=3029425 RepID=A0ABT6XVW9_ALISE|nr:DUF1932 domain-containing protein [Alicyclobacillus sendaiensis]MDI9259216.1 DUF1932 domain-containing protein [Alicyclobacillus sendaiensis PA2]